MVRSALLSLLCVGLACATVPAQSDIEPDIAYDETHDVYLVVWNRSTGTFSGEVWGQLKRPNGSNAGAPFKIGDGITPKVGNVDVRDRFVVVYSRSAVAFMRSVSPANGFVSAEIVLYNPNCFCALKIAEVTDSSGGRDEAAVLILHWLNFEYYYGDAVAIMAGVSPIGRPQKRAIFYRIPAFGYYLNGSMIEVGSTGAYLIALEDRGAVSNSLWGTTVISASSYSSWSRVTQMNTGYSPDLAGSGTEYVVTYNVGSDILCRPISTGVSGSVVGSDVTVTRGREPSVIRAEGSYLVGYNRTPGGQNRTSYVDSIDSFACTPCEGTFTVSSGPAHTSEFAFRTRGGQRTDDGLLAWREGNAGSTIRTLAFNVDDGHITDLGGGCSPGGFASASCARVGNANFHHTLSESAPSSPVTLVLGAGQIQFACGPCSLVVDPNGAVVLPVGNTTANGSASFNTPLPNVPALVGVKLIEQWLVASGGGCSPFGIAFSNGIEVEIQ